MSYYVLLEKYRKGEVNELLLSCKSTSAAGLLRAADAAGPGPGKAVLNELWPCCS